MNSKSKMIEDLVKKNMSKDKKGIPCATLCLSACIPWPCFLN